MLADPEPSADLIAPQDRRADGNGPFRIPLGRMCASKRIAAHDRYGRWDSDVSFAHNSVGVDAAHRDPQLSGLPEFGWPDEPGEKGKWLGALKPNVGRGCIAQHPAHDERSQSTQ